jgi:23S rRNA pseudouridine1911/1915/1917 synthase
MSEIVVLYEDDDILIIDKPSRITVNRSDTTKDEPTVQDWVETHLKTQIKNPIIRVNIESDFYKRAGIVHRLDKETSGILVIAKTEPSFVDLQAQFKERKVSKTYIAMVHGLVSPIEGEISAPVGRLPWNRRHFGVLAGGREASTKYKVLNIKYLELSHKKEPLSLMELNPKTGRTHQIRVHLKYINHPIFADPLYGGRKTSRDDRKILDRVFLHAQKIIFTHPVSKKQVNFSSPLPQELTSLLNNLKN